MTSPEKKPRPLPATDKRALQPYLKMQLEVDREMRRILSDSLRSITRELNSIGIRSNISSKIRVEQLLAAKRAILKEQAQIYARAGNLIASARYEAAAAAVKATGHQGSMLRRAFAGRVGGAEALEAAMEQFARASVDLGRTRLMSSRVELARSVYKAKALADGTVDRLITGYITRGTSAREIARGVKGYINPNVRGGVSYAAQRLGRTELNNAFHASQVAVMREQPWVEAAKWNLSSSHPRPDECDEYAEHVADGRDEPGSYALGEVPRKPHPQCLCFMTSLTLEVDDFMKNLNAGKYDNAFADPS